MAKITATFDQRVTRDGYCLGVTISDYDDTDPVSLERCILVNLSGASSIVRAATILDLYNYSIPYSYPLIHVTGDGILNDVQVGDIVTFNTVPEYWEISELVSTLSLPVTNVTDAPSFGCVHLNTSTLVYSEFACGFDGILNLTVTRGSNTIVPEDDYSIVVGRFPNGSTLPTYNQVLQTYYPVKRSVTIFATQTEALNKIEAIKAELQSLVTESNTTGVDFETTTVEVFE
jgi:hypothetical protein